MGTTPTVLVVDDFPDTAQTLADLLNHSGFCALAATSSDAALAVAAEVRPVVVVLEPLMWGGWEMAEQLRGRGGTGPALVALTCGPLTRLGHGADGFDYVALKGTDPRAVVAAVTLCAKLDA